MLAIEAGADGSMAAELEDRAATSSPGRPVVARFRARKERRGRGHHFLSRIKLMPFNRIEVPDSDPLHGGGNGLPELPVGRLKRASWALMPNLAFRGSPSSVPGSSNPDQRECTINRSNRHPIGSSASVTKCCESKVRNPGTSARESHRSSWRCRCDSSGCGLAAFETSAYSPEE